MRRSGHTQESYRACGLWQIPDRDFGNFRIWGLGLVGHRLRRHGMQSVLSHTGREYAETEASEGQDIRTILLLTHD